MNKLENTGVNQALGGANPSPPPFNFFVSREPVKTGFFVDFGRTDT